jgi:hypothetical protein
MEVIRKNYAQKHSSCLPKPSLRPYPTQRWIALQGNASVHGWRLMPPLLRSKQTSRNQTHRSFQPPSKRAKLKLRRAPRSRCFLQRTPWRSWTAFIQQETPLPAPKTAFFTPQQAAKRSLDDSAGLVTETLARIYAKQGNVAKAKAAYEKLALKYPDKSAYFAALSQALDAQQYK